MASAGWQNSGVARYERYQRVVAELLKHSEFSLVHVKRACTWGKRVFVTRIVRLLEKDGLLKELGVKTNPLFRWKGDREESSMAQWIAAFKEKSL